MVTIKIGRFGGLDLPAQTDDLHIDAAVVGLGVAPGQKLQQLIAGQHPSRPLHEGAQQAELAMRERNLLAHLIHQDVAAEV